MTKNAGRGAQVRVVINALHAKSGGGVTYLRNLLPRLAADGRLEIHLLIAPGQRSLLAPIDQRIAVCERACPAGIIALALWEQLAVPAIARKLDAAVTFSPANFGPFFAPGSVIMLRNAVAVGRGERRLFKQLYWRIVSLATTISAIRARRVIAVSEYARTHLAGRLGKTVRDRTAIVPHGVDTAFRPDGADNVREPFVLAVGDIYIQKNFETLIDALAILRGRSHDIALRIAGETIDGDYRNGLDARIRDRGLEGQITFLGRLSRDALIALYRSCRVFVFPSTVETFGQPLLEAMACGAPVVSSNTTAMPQTAGDAALYCDPTDPDAMADLIEAVLNDDALARDLSARGIERARHFSIDETARRTADLLIAAADGTADPT